MSNNKHVDEALQDDPTLGPAATVLRENAALRTDIRQQKRMLLWLGLSCTLLVLAFVATLATMLFGFPKFRYIVTQDNRAICGAVPVQLPGVTPAVVAQFAQDAIISAYTYDYVNYRSILTEVTNKYFTNTGRKSFFKTIDDSGNLDKVVSNRLILRAMAVNVPQLEAEGVRDGAYFWRVQIPLQVEFYTGGAEKPSSSQRFLATVTVVREPASALNVKGIAVDGIVLAPYVGKS